MKAALEAGANFWNGGEFYGTPEYNSMTILEKYFEKYPEDADKVVLSIKGATGVDGFHPDSSPKEIRRSMDAVIKQLKGRKKVDLFECARRDGKTPLEETFSTLQKEYIDRGLLGGISLSEVSADTIRDAVKVAKITAIEVELSLWSMDILSNDVAKVAAQHSIPIVAYSPIGRGVSTTVPMRDQVSRANQGADAEWRDHVTRRHPTE
jgi:pyridoxine 4-dehydrogenase